MKWNAIRPTDQNTHVKMQCFLADSTLWKDFLNVYQGTVYIQKAESQKNTLSTNVNDKKLLSPV